MVTEGGDTQSLFNCYRKNGVAFGKEYCEFKFNKTADPEVTNSQILDCLAFNNVPKGKEFCELTFVGDDGFTLQQRVDCYERYFVKDKEYCDVKSIVNYDQTLQECYLEAGYTLDKQFCEESYPLDRQPSLQAQLDSIYGCYDSLDLTYPNSDAVVEGGFKIFKDREYCEILHLSDSTKKYQCVQEVAIPNMEAALREACEVENPLNVDGCYEVKLNALKDMNKHERLGGDYCFITYFWQEQYDDLYNCLEEQGVQKDASYCESKF